MRIPGLHRTPRRSIAQAAPSRHRRAVVLGGCSLALVLAGVGTVAAMGDQPTGKAYAPSAVVARPTAAANPTPIESPAVIDSPAAIAGAPQQPESSSTSNTARPALADGTYPTFIRGVDVLGATVTVDVIQVFQDKAAVDAAIEDGKPADEAEYLYVYLRNQNPLLRTFPVARDVRIDFLGACESPPDRNAAMAELARKTTPFDPAYYYEVTIRDGAIDQIEQRLAVSAC